MLKGQCKGAKLVYQAEKKNLHCKSDELLHSKEEQNNKPHLHLNLCLCRTLSLALSFFSSKCSPISRSFSLLSLYLSPVRDRESIRASTAR